jgi:hypothetical protein
MVFAKLTDKFILLYPIFFTYRVVFVILNLHNMVCNKGGEYTDTV